MSNLTYRTGLVLGKFYPPHQGHYHLIETALSKVDRLTIIVCGRVTEAPPASLRATWLRELYPKADVIVVMTDGFPEDDSVFWAEMTLRTLGFTPSVVFTSEKYGDPWAKAMGCEHVFVGRGDSGLSGTRVRADPLSNFIHLAKPVQAYYVKRICIMGAESTGKTTLAEALASYYHTSYVPEYGRQYTDEKHAAGDHTWRSDEFLTIALKQLEIEDQAALTSGPLLICDTDALDTALWHERLVGGVHAQVLAMAEQRRYDLHVLTLTGDTPFVQDGQREEDNLREWMETRIIQEFHRRGREYIIVTGSPAERLEKVVREIRRRWPQIQPLAA